MHGGDWLGRSHSSRIGHGPLQNAADQKFAITMGYDTVQHIDRISRQREWCKLKSSKEVQIRML